MFRAIFAWRRQKSIPATWYAMNMIISCLKRIGIEPWDEIFLATDYMGSWRKEWEKEYKSGRKAFRDSFVDIDWKDMYAKFDDLLERLDRGTGFHICRIEHMEADDFMAVGAKLFRDKEVILVTYDSDLEQMWSHSNVKIFSPIKKFKGGKGAYKVPPKNFNVYKLISKKIEKEVVDGLTNPILNENDFEKRKLVIDLLNLPEFIEEPIKEELVRKIEETKDINPNEVPFDTIRKKLGIIYNDKSKVIKYEDCVEKSLKKKKKRRKK